jgi:hypothetical protein
LTSYKNPREGSAQAKEGYYQAFAVKNEVELSHQAVINQISSYAPA